MDVDKIRVNLLKKSKNRCRNEDGEWEINIALDDIVDEMCRVIEDD